MLCIFKTICDPHPSITGKLVARKNAGACQALCQALVAVCEHDHTVRHQKEGRYVLAFERKRRFRGVVITPEQESALRRTPDLELFGLEERDELVGEALDLASPVGVMISSSCVKSDGTPITLADFPTGWSFGNGVSVGVTVPIAGSDPCVLSYAIFPAGSESVVRAEADVLKNIFEN